MTYKINSKLLLPAICLALSSLVHAQLAPGLSLNFDANDAASGIDSNNWNSLTADATQDFDFGADVTLETVTSAGTQITKAYRFTNNTGDNNNPTWNGLFGEGVATTWEFWLKPDDAGDANQVIYESGGSGTGYAIWYSVGTASDGFGTVHFTIDGGSGAQVETVSAVIDTSDFRQITCVYNESGSGSIDVMQIWVDGALVDDNLSATTSDDVSNDNDNTSIDDYCGGDGTGLGNANNSLANDASDGEFDGDIAAFRVWGGKALTPTEISDNYSVLGGPDTDPPSISNLDPSDEATDAYPGADLTATFSEEIALTGSGSITITDLTDGTGTFTINLPDGQVSTSFDQLIINPTSNLEFNTSYEISIDGLAIQDTADTPNAYAGTSAGQWNFTTVAEDLTPPVTTGFDPADNSTEVLLDATLTATFDENIVAGSGNIRIVDVSGPTTLQTIAISDGSQVAISANSLVITPGSPLPAATELAIQIDAGAVRNFSEVDFAGIADTTTWSFTTASTTTFTGTGSNNTDSWNDASKWDIAVPSGALNAVIPDGLYAEAWNDATPTFTGNLSIGAGSTLGIGWTSNRPNSFNALGTAGQTTITMGAGSLIKSRTQASPTVPAIVLTGNATFSCGESTQNPASPNFAHPITGAHQFTVQSNANGITITLGANNTFDGLVTNAISGRGNDMGTVRGTVAGAFGAGDVTINTSNGDKTLKLECDASGAFAATATLNINGRGPSGDGSNRIQMDADNTIQFLNVEGFAYPAGTYGRVGTPATVDHEVDWMAGDSALTVTNGPADTTPPTVVITDNSVDGELFQATQATITYTLTFDEPINTTATTTDFDSIGTATVTIDSVNQISLNVLQVAVTASDVGTVLLRAKDTASFSDLSGNTLAGPICDDNLVTMRDSSLLSSELGILNLTNNNGVNPATGKLWRVGDTYRLAFVTNGTIAATSNDIATYNTFVQNAADASSLGLSSATWKAIASAAGDGGSIPAVNARTNTSTDSGTGEAIYLLNGTTRVAANYADLWDGNAANHINLDEEAAARSKATPVFSGFGAVWTGTANAGTASSALGNGGNCVFGLFGAEAKFWVNRGNTGPSNLLPLYALSDPLTIGGTTPPTAYDAWVADYPGLGGSTAPTDNPDGDNLNNQLEFAFGTNPTVSDSATLTWDGSTLTRGTPAIYQNFEAGGGVTFKARFMRRIDHGQSGSYNYNWLFSSDLTDWESSADTPPWFVSPTCIAVDGDYELVEVPYPFFLSTYKKARFFQVEISAAP